MTGQGGDARFDGLAWDPSRMDAVSVLAVGRVGSLLTASGQIAVADGELIAQGTLGEDVDVPTAQRSAWQCALNVLDAVRTELGGLEGVRAHRITVYVASGEGFTDQHLVGHGASAALFEVLGADRGRHTRAAIGVRALPLGTPVEVDGVFEVISD